MEQGSCYFLSRPRRFGKSLFIDTLKDMFEGNRELFTGLAADDRWDWSVKYPVIRLSFGAGVVHTRLALDQTMHQQLAHHEKRFDLPPDFPDLRSRFIDLIERLHTQTGQRVVVLVDEYDKPMFDNITEPAIAREMRDGLRNLYSVIQDSDTHVKFAMLTGVSKSSLVSLFSELNNLQDITLSKPYTHCIDGKVFDQMHQPLHQSPSCRLPQGAGFVIPVSHPMYRADDGGGFGVALDQFAQL